MESRKPSANVKRELWSPEDPQRQGEGARETGRMAVCRGRVKTKDEQIENRDLGAGKMAQPEKYPPTRPDDLIWIYLTTSMLKTADSIRVPCSMARACAQVDARTLIDVKI